MPVVPAVRQLHKRGKMKRPCKKTKAPLPQTETKTEENPWNPHTHTLLLPMLLTALFQVQSNTWHKSQCRTDTSPLSEHLRRSMTIG